MSGGKQARGIVAGAWRRSLNGITSLRDRLRDRNARRLLIATVGLGAVVASCLAYESIVELQLEQRIHQRAAAHRLDVEYTALDWAFPGLIEIDGLQVAERAGCWLTVQHLQAETGLVPSSALRRVRASGLEAGCPVPRAGLSFQDPKGRVEIGRVDWDGLVAVTGGRWTMDRADLSLPDQPLIEGLEGRITLDTPEAESPQAHKDAPRDAGSNRAPPQGLLESLLEHASIHVELDTPPDTAKTLVRAHAHAGWIRGRLTKSSRASLEFPGMHWVDPDRSLNRLSPGARVSINAARSAVGASSATAEAADLELRVPAFTVESHDEQPIVRVNHLVLSAVLPREGSPPGSTPSVRGRCSDLTLTVGERRMQTEVAFAATLVPFGWLHRDFVRSATVDLNDARVISSGASAPFSGQLRLERIAFTPEGWFMAGKLDAQGADADVLLRLAGATELPSWVREKFLGEPFQLEGDLHSKPSGMLRLTGLHVQRGALTMTGWLNWVADGATGRLLLKYGGLAAGIAVKPAGAKLQLSPGKDWLGQSGGV